ncbi:MAG: NACHT domain-containing protein [Gammaproteobacteria bacterium]|nr:NACHT domain-containing protein [Gammaproteobacteria bacterium]
MDLLQTYLERIIQTRQRVDTRGMLQNQDLNELTLDDIYVPLTACLEDDTSDLRDILREAEMRRQLVEFPDEQEPSTEFLLRDRPRAETDLSIDALWSRGNQWMLLGGGGAGKTTLLNYLTLTHARNLHDSEQGDLPIPVELRKFSRAWQARPEWETENAILSYLMEIGLAEMHFSDSEQRQTLLSSIKIALTGHSALLLFDGLDGILDSGLRQRSSEAIEALLCRYPGNRCLISSHIIGYQTTLFSQSFLTATLESFGGEQIRRFFHQWLYAMEKQEDIVVDAATRQRAEQKTNELLVELRQHPEICLQIASPLLCTLIALVHRQTGSLPRQQIELYKLCVDAFILQWEMHKRRHCMTEAVLNKDETQHVLEAIALHFQEHCEENRMPAAEILEIIRCYLQDEQGMNQADAQYKAEQFLELVRMEGGLLCDCGGEEFGYFHLTFQEYLAARAIARKPEIIEHHLREHLFHPRWRGVIRLAAAHQGMKDEEAGSAFIEAIQRHPHPRENEMRYSFRIAFQCMRETRVGFSVADRMFNTWVRLYLEQSVLQPALNRLLRYKGGILRYNPKAVTPLLEAVNSQDAAVRGKAVEALGNLKDPQAVPVLLNLLKTDTQSLVRAKAAEVLGGFKEPAAVPALLTALQDDGAFFVRRRAAQALSQIKAPQALPAMLALLKSSDTTMRWRGVEALGNLKDLGAVPELIEVLRLDGFTSVRWRAAEALGNLNDPASVPALLNALKHDADVTVRGRTAEALGHFKPIEVLAALLDALKNGALPTVRWRTAEALGNLKDTHAVPALLRALKEDMDNAVRWSAAEALGRIKDSSAVPALLSTLKEDVDASVRWSAAEALGHLRDRSAVPALLSLLSDDQYASVRARACQALGFLKDLTATPALLKILQEDSDATVRRRAAEALGYLKDANAVSALITALKKDEDTTVRWSSAEALGNLKDTTAIPALLAALQTDADVSVRRRAAQTLELIDLGGVM